MVLLQRALMQLRAPLRFRLDFLSSVVGNVVVMAVGATLLGTLFQHVPSLSGWGAWEVIFLWAWAETVMALVHFSCAGLFVFNRRYLVNGELDRMLVRPGDPLIGVLVENLAVVELPGVLVAGSVLAVAAVQAGVGWAAIGVVPALLGSLAIFGSILVVFASLGFHVRHSGTAVGVVFQAASYARYPLELYPKPVRAALTVGLVAFLAYVPAAGLLGRLSWGWAHLPVALAAMLGARRFFQFGLGRYSSSGA